MKTIDLRPRCQLCKKLPRGKAWQERFKRYTPYCSFHCQEWAKIDNGLRRLAELKPAP